MKLRFRKFALTAHVTFSVGWLGAVAAYLAPATAGLVSEDEQMARGAYLVMDLIARFVIVPCALAALLTGLFQSLATEWGLLRHYWVFVKFVLTIVAVSILLLHMPTVNHVTERTLASADLGALRTQLFVHALGGLLVLISVTALSVYKPWGRIRYGTVQRS